MQLVKAMTLVAICVIGLGAVQAPEPFFDALDDPAIGYSTQRSDDAVTRLARRLDAGEAQLAFEPGTGYLRSLLRELDVPISSQMAVYSKTSFQAPIIDPAHPRTIFFNDAVAVAWPRGGFIEIAAQDARQGTRFFLLDQHPENPPRFTPSTRCNVCHHSSTTGGVPGLFTRSIVTGPDGATAPWLGNNTSDHRSPLNERWAGWYVTGRVGDAKHLGNTFVRATVANPGAESHSGFDTPATLVARFETDAYLSPYSDVVALLVFQHQTRMMNLLTRIGWEVRIAKAEAGSSGTAAAAAAAETTAKEVVDYLLFIDEAPLPGPIAGTSGFTEQFAVRGPRDRQGRSLRDLDLNQRLLRYPCSYMIYSDVFEALPTEARAAIYARMWHILSGRAGDSKYRRLTGADRQSIVDILRDTKSSLPDYFGRVEQ
jgi:hypothetical protein